MSSITNENCLIKCKNAEFITQNQRRVSGLSLEVLKGDNIYIISSEIGLQNEILLFLAGFTKLQGGELSLSPNKFKRDICFVPQDMDSPQSVLDIVIGHERCGLFDFSKKKRIIAKAEEMLEKTGMLETKKSRFSDLSTGQKKRVLISKSLFSSADIVFLECPTEGLDAVAADNVNLLLKDCGKTVIRSSLDLMGALEYADKILLADYDEHFFGTPEEFMATYG